MPIPSETVTDSDEKKEGSVTRRAFVRVAAGAVGCFYVGAFGYPIYRYLNAPVEQAIAEEKNNTVVLKGADKLPPGSTMMFLFNATQSMLIHFADGTWVALSAVCTHLGCTLTYHSPDPLITCQCHGGQYNPRTGQNVGGPPPRPLTKYSVEVGAGTVTVTRA